MRRSDDGWGSSLFKKLAGRGGHYRVIWCASGMAICLPHEAASRVACRRACLLIGLICSTMLNKSLSEAWRYAYFVCRLLFLCHTGGECGKHLMTSSPLACKSSWKPALVWRNDGDGLSITIGVSDVSSMVIYPVVGWGFHLKPSFQCKRESCPERNARPDRWSLVEEGSTPVWVAAVWGGGIGGIIGGECDEPAASSLIIIITPGTETARSGGVWWGTPDMN